MIRQDSTPKMAKEKAASLLGPRPQIKNNTLSTAFRRSRRVTALQGVEKQTLYGWEL